LEEDTMVAQNSGETNKMVRPSHKEADWTEILQTQVLEGNKCDLSTKDIRPTIEWDSTNVASPWWMQEAMDRMIASATSTLWMVYTPIYRWKKWTNNLREWAMNNALSLSHVSVIGSVIENELDLLNFLTTVWVTLISIAISI
jgi:hypothetical protein